MIWTQEQARALRAARPAGVDWVRVAEEIEDMGKRDLRAAESLLASSSTCTSSKHLLGASPRPTGAHKFSPSGAICAGP